MSILENFPRFFGVTIFSVVFFVSFIHFEASWPSFLSSKLVIWIIQIQTDPQARDKWRAGSQTTSRSFLCISFLLLPTMPGVSDVFLLSCRRLWR